VQNENWNYAASLPESTAEYKKDSVKGSQFAKPLFEFSGACAGCGETPYVKLITQLFGDRMVVANATGCSSIYGGSAPTCPYTVNGEGHGPAWANSLFEDNAEFGLGMSMALNQRRAKLADLVGQLASAAPAAKTVADAWLAGKDEAKASKEAGQALLAYVKANPSALGDEIAGMADLLTKKSTWLIGGDGWAYDIGYGGLDHVLAANHDLNIIVLDTEVYSNTGGQASKSTPTGSVAKFAAAGKRVKKKDLGMMAMSYGYVYVATVAMGANPAQLLKAVTEAEAYPGPSLIIAYAPCINHGIDMAKTQAEEKKAVDTGYWQLYRYNPLLAAEGKNPFTLDSKEPSGDYLSFLEGEVRYSSLKKLFPDAAERLFRQSAQDAKDRLASYKKLASG
ncbi:MAG: pyruvate:ferredoxin (flavodoxin) oxidoreductase, partial [Peptococcaceae bacterium]|nr:pyruvate:ferredoxin (flavodoxin) oxidoreductase [Peptococcaceae bacterium]